MAATTEKGYNTESSPSDGENPTIPQTNPLSQTESNKSDAIRARVDPQNDELEPKQSAEASDAAVINYKTLNWW